MNLPACPVLVYFPPHPDHQPCSTRCQVPGCQGRAECQGARWWTMACPSGPWCGPSPHPLLQQLLLSSHHMDSPLTGAGQGWAVSTIKDWTEGKDS